MNGASKVKSFLTSFKKYWKTPPEGRYMPYKEIFSLSVGGMGVKFTVYCISQMVITVGNTLIGNTIGIDPSAIYVIYIISILAGFPLTAVRARMIDNTRSMKGKYRPYILTMGIPSVLLGIGFGVIFPAMNTLYINLAPNNQRATATSTYLTAWDVGIGIGIATSGIIAQHFTFYMVYLSHTGTVLCDHLSPKKLLDKMRYACKDKPEPDKALCRQFNKETRDGKHMRHYSDLLQSAIESIVTVKEKSDIDDFLNGVQGNLFAGEIRGLDDFELICFLVIK